MNKKSFKRPHDEFQYFPVEFSHKAIYERLETLENDDSDIIEHNADPASHDDIRKKLHEHLNETVIDKIGESNGKLTFDGKEVESAPIDRETGNASFLGEFNTFADLVEIQSPEKGNVVVVLEDETSEDIRTLYTYHDDEWTKLSSKVWNASLKLDDNTTLDALIIVPERPRLE